MDFCPRTALSSPIPEFCGGFAAPNLKTVAQNGPRAPGPGGSGGARAAPRHGPGRNPCARALDLQIVGIHRVTR